MSKRPALSPMSSLLPPKGMAAIPEEVESLGATAMASQPASQLPSQMNAIPVAEQRVNVSVRLPHAVVRRLREAAFRLEREKQDIVTDALDIWLSREGF